MRVHEIPLVVQIVLYVKADVHLVADLDYAWIKVAINLLLEVKRTILSRQLFLRTHRCYRQFLH